MQLDTIRRDIPYRRQQILRQRKLILDLQRVGLSTRTNEELLERMLTKVDELCRERDRLRVSEKLCYPGTSKEIRGAQRR